jgi:hypothetical protein
MLSFDPPVLQVSGELSFGSIYAAPSDDGELILGVPIRLPHQSNDILVPFGGRSPFRPRQVPLDQTYEVLDATLELDVLSALRWTHRPERVATGTIAIHERRPFLALAPDGFRNHWLSMSDGEIVEFLGRSILSAHWLIVRPESLGKPRRVHFELNGS